MSKHIIQSPQWGEFKTKYGTPAVRVNGTNNTYAQYTIHKIPKTNFAVAYCPKVNPENIDWEPLIMSAKENGCFRINFDAPYVLKGTPEEKRAVALFETHENVRKAPKNLFTKYNILLDLTGSENELLANMASKHRYNIKYAQKSGVTTRIGETPEDFEIFWKLSDETAKRQKFLIHPREYYLKVWETLHPEAMAHLLITEFKGEPLAAWMLFTYENVLYYPYGSSSEKHKNLHASNLIGWEAIKFGKARGCKIFDMWGACKDLEDATDPEWGFSNFKIKFGGRHVEYMDSYDYVINPTLYKLFNVAYPMAIGLLKKLK